MGLACMLLQLTVALRPDAHWMKLSRLNRRLSLHFHFTFPIGNCLKDSYAVLEGFHRCVKRKERSGVLSHSVQNKWGLLTRQTRRAQYSPQFVKSLSPGGKNNDCPQAIQEWGGGVEVLILH